MHNKQHIIKYNIDNHQGTYHAGMSVWTLYLNKRNPFMIGIILVMITLKGKQQEVSVWGKEDG